MNLVNIERCFYHSSVNDILIDIISDGLCALLSAFEVLRVIVRHEARNTANVRKHNRILAVLHEKVVHNFDGFDANS